MDWDKMSNLYMGPSINASYQVSVHLAEQIQSPLHHDYCDYFLTYKAGQSKFFTNLNRKEKGG
jgi:copper oxidase (laccase) domain-containing protein